MTHKGDVGGLGIGWILAFSTLGKFNGEVSSVAVLFFRLLLKNTERCPQQAVSINFLGTFVPQQLYEHHQQATPQPLPPLHHTSP